MEISEKFGASILSIQTPVLGIRPWKLGNNLLRNIAIQLTLDTHHYPEHLFLRIAYSEAVGFLRMSLRSAKLFAFINTLFNSVDFFHRLLYSS